MYKIYTYFATVGQRTSVYAHPKRFWTNGDGLILSKNWTNKARPQVSKNVSFLKEGGETAAFARGMSAEGRLQRRAGRAVCG